MNQVLFGGNGRKDDLSYEGVRVVDPTEGIDETLDLERLRSTWLETADQARAAGHVDAELRSLYFLGRLHHDLGDFDGALEAYGRVVARGEEEGLTWTPFAAEARQMVASVGLVSLRSIWLMIDLATPDCSDSSESERL